MTDVFDPGAGKPPREPFTILAHGMLGYGFPIASLEEAERRGFDLIAIDAGSTDPGPYYLGSGKPFISRTMVERDLELLIPAAFRAGGRLVIGSSGGAGTRGQLAFVADIVRDVVRRSGRQGVRLATIDSELEPTSVSTALAEGRIETFETGEALTQGEIDASSHIVAQIGLEPMMAALAAGADILVCGRAWDVANVAALPVMLGYPRGLALHLGKILECGGQAAVPVEGSDLLIGRLTSEDFTVESPHALKACTVESVAAHTLYEKSNPVWLPGPGGIVDLKSSTFEALDEKRVRVTGSRFHAADVQTVKLEGARRVGHRHLAIAGVRDPIMIGQLDSIFAAITERMARNLEGSLRPDAYSVLFRPYGINAVMGALEPSSDVPHEVGLVIDVVGETPAIAESVCAMARSLALHWGYPGRKATSGNLAFPFSPADFPAGEVYAFNIYHLMRVADPAAAFPFVMETL